MPRPFTPRPTPPSPTRSRRGWRLWFTLSLGLLAVIALGVSLTVLVARDAIATRVARLGHELGLEIRWREIDLPLLGEIALRGVSIGRASDGRVLSTIAELRTDVTLLDALGGARRPSALTLTGGDLHLSFVDGHLEGFEELFARPAAPHPAQAPPPTAPLTIELRGWSVTIDAEAERIAAERVFVDDLDLTLRRDAQRRLRLEATASVRAAAHQTPTHLSWSSEGGLDLRFDRGLQLGAATPLGPVWLGIEQLRRRPRDHITELIGLGLRHGADHLGVARVALHDRSGRPLPSPGDLTGVSVTDLAIERGGARLVAAAARVSLDASNAGRPRPTHLSATELGVETKDRRLRGSFATAELDLNDPWEALGAGRPLDAIAAVTLGAPHLTATLGGPPGSGPLGGSDLLGRLIEPPSAGDNTEETAAAPPSPPASVDTDADTNTGARARLAALLDRARAWQLAVTDGQVDVRDDAGGAVLRLAGVGLSTREVRGGLLELDFIGAVERGGRETGRVDVQAAFDARASLAYVKGRVSGRDLAHQISRFSEHVEVQPDAQVDLTFSYTRPTDPAAPHRVEGRAHLEHFTFHYWRVADATVKDLEGEISFDLSVFPQEHRALLKLPELRVGRAHFEASLDVTRPPGGRPRFLARLTMPRQDCGAAARSIPRALIPRLSQLSLRGSMRFDASLKLDLAKPRELELAVTGDLDRCAILRLGPGIHPERLRGDFVHHPREPERGTLREIRVGRGTDEWIPSEELPELVKATAWVTEDRRYFEHAGVRWDLIERALKMDLAHERFVYGGSTITQQLVKNLYLDRGKTLARKLEEAIIAWQLERVLTKDEILTIYVNVIEYGPDIYGVKHAARFYFNKRVDQLTPLEIAFIMGLKPYPARGYLQWQAGKLKPWWVRRLKHVLGMVAKRTELLTKAEAEAFAPYQPTFRRPDERIAPPPAPRDPARGPGGDEPGGAWAPWGIEDKR